MVDVYRSIPPCFCLFEKVVLCYTLTVFLSRSVFVSLFFSSQMNTHLILLRVDKGKRKGLFIENI